MRCANCGTDNAPDSRFCGGCGARVQSSGLVAPTQKISDDAPYPTSGPSSIPPQNYSPASVPPQNYQSGPASIPPQSYAPASIPPQNSYQTGPPSIAPQPRMQTAPPVAQPPAGHPRAQGPVPTPQGTPSQPRPRTNGVPPGRPPGRPPGSANVSRRQAPAVSDPSLTAPPRRRWGLIITVLLIDLALAGAGVYLLTEGLA